MSWSTRRSALVLALLAVAGSFAFAQQIQIIKGGGVVIAKPVPGPGGPGTQPQVDEAVIQLPKDNDRRKMIEAAIEYAKEKDWKTATETLQKVLKYPEDKMVDVPRPVGAGGKVVMVPVSARREAERLIGELDPDGLEWYRQTYGPEAKELLDRAKANGKTDDLKTVMNYYLHTDAGATATHLLALRSLDRGDYIPACLCYERLLGREEADKLPSTVLFEAVYANRLGGNKVKEEELLKQIVERGDSIHAGGVTLRPEEVSDVLAKVKRGETYSCVYDYPMVGGSHNRNAQQVGGTPFLERRWVQQLLHDANIGQAQTWLNQANGMLQRRHPVIPAFQPITVTLNQNGQLKPLIVMRSYSGIVAVELTTGKIAWDSPSKWGLETMAQSGKSMQAVNGWVNWYIQNNRPSIVYENSIVGTLTTDGTYVFAVEDFAVPPPPWANQNMGGINPGFPGQPQPPVSANKDLSEALAGSKLVAYDLTTNGKVKWEIGGTGKDVALADSFFLGPPLPLGGKVYALIEKQQELRLACIDAATGKVLSTQVLVLTRDKFQNDIDRRTEAAHLAYGEGILVCPTNAGGILGVDLLTNSLLWAYTYREEQGGQNPNGNPGGGIGIGGRFPNQAPTASSRWKVTPPIIQDGRVIFTAPDAGSVHCLNLRDGTPIWSQKRQEEDLYLAGVFNGKVVVVGKRQTRAFSLAKGELAWTLETGLPNGFGVASDNKYFLPIKESALTKEPEVCIIDVDKGEFVAHTKSRMKDGKREVPGTLTFYEGDVLSQTDHELVAYPQLAVRLEQVTKMLDKDPKNPIGLTDRGELRLDRGELGGAIADLSLALDLKPDAATKAKARLKLYESMTDYLARDFNKAEAYLEKYRDLCTIEIPADLDAKAKEDLKIEENRRQGMLHYLVAKGRQDQGKLVEAFDEYQKYSQVAGTEKLVTSPDDTAVRTAPDVWTGARIKKMMEGASAEQRKPLEAKITAQWDDLKKNAKDLDEIRQFVRLFGSAFAVGKEARLELANRLIESSEANALIEAELDLAMLRGSHEDPNVAGRAVETLARLNAQKGLLPDAAFYYRELRDHYPKVVVRDGKTGAEVFDDMESNKFLLPHLHDGGPAVLTGKVSFGKEEKTNPNGAMMQQMNSSYTFGQTGEELPFFKQYRISLMNTHNVKITNRYQPDEKPRMDVHLSTTQFHQMLTVWNPQGGQITPQYNFQNMGHLVVLSLGHRVFGIDPVNGKQLWEKDLYGTTNGNGLPQWGQQPNGMPPITVDPRDNTVQIVYIDGWMQRIGQTSSLEGQVICLQTRESLQAIDPLSGRTLWTRSDLSSHSQILSDEDHFYVVELNGEGNPSSTRVLRAQDGVTVKAPDFALLFQKRLRMWGRNLLLVETNDDAKKTVSLRLYDVLTGKDQWKKDFAPGSIPLNTDESDLTGMVEPDGKLHVYDLRSADGTELFKDAKIDPKHLDKVHKVELFTDAHDVYVACNADTDPNLMPWGGVQSNLMPQTGLRSLGINGELYSFKRDGGELNWHNPVPNQMLVLEHFKELPVMLFTARYMKWMNQGLQKVPMNMIATESIEKQTGKLKFFREEQNNGQQAQFQALLVDYSTGKIELVSYTQKLVHELLINGDKSGKEKPGKEGGEKKEDPKKVGVEPTPVAPPQPPRPPVLPPRIIKD